VGFSIGQINNYLNAYRPEFPDIHHHIDSSLPKAA
jgi:hypothetical protein